MDIDYFLRTKYEENQVEGVLRTEELYKNISNTYLKHLFAVMHQSINGLLSFMQSKKGSYAKVFRYRDEFYNKFFVLKRAKNDLNDKELERFKREFDVMNELKSPYVLEVHRYDEEKNEYYMEYADETLKKFI